MAKALTDIRSLARVHTDTAIRVLAGIMGQTDAPHAARVSAASQLLDRGWGKPAQALEHTGAEGGAIRTIIEQHIVDPKG
jgi:hypothetical protein